MSRTIATNLLPGTVRPYLHNRRELDTVYTLHEVGTKVSQWHGRCQQEATDSDYSCWGSTTQYLYISTVVNQRHNYTDNQNFQGPVFLWSNKHSSEYVFVGTRLGMYCTCAYNGYQHVCKACYTAYNYCSKLYTYGPHLGRNAKLPVSHQSTDRLPHFLHLYCPTVFWSAVWGWPSSLQNISPWGLYCNEHAQHT